MGAQKAMQLHQAITKYLEQHTNDDDIVALFKRVRTLQANSVQLRQAIYRACTTDTQTKIRISTKHIHKDNLPAYLAIRHRAKLLKYRAEGYGYGKIAKLMAQRNIYNKKTKKAYSRSTIQRALQLLQGRENV
jgi:hypothetical protein